MSRDYIDDPREDMAWSLRRIDDSIQRIADTIDDFMDMSLAGLLATHKMSTLLDSETAAAFKPLLDGLQAIADRRAAR